MNNFTRKDPPTRSQRSFHRTNGLLLRGEWKEKVLQPALRSWEPRSAVCPFPVHSSAAGRWAKYHPTVARTIPYFAKHFFFLVCLCFSLDAQVTVTFSPQTPELTRIAWGQIGKRLETWNITICNNGSAAGEKAPENASVSSGNVYRAAQAHGLPAANRAMALAAVMRAKDRNPATVIVRVLGVSALVATALVSAGVFDSQNGRGVARSIKIGLPIFGMTAEIIGGELKRSIPEERLQRFDQEVLEDGHAITLEPGMCASRILFASRIRGAKGFTEQIGGGK